jgi:hypothetical protein
MQDGVENGSGSIALKGQPACSHFVENYAERKKIRARIQLFAKCLLRRHVCNGAQSRSWARQLFRIRTQRSQRLALSTCNLRTRHFCEAEIQNLGVAPLGHKDVRRFDVPVDDALGVRCVQPVRDLNGDVEQTL